MDDILIGTRRREMHRVDVDFGKERCWSRDNGRNEDVASLSNLTEVASVYVPGNVEAHVWPPEASCNCRFGCIDSFVTDVVVNLLHNVKS